MNLYQATPMDVPLFCTSTTTMVEACFVFAESMLPRALVPSGGFPHIIWLFGTGIRLLRPANRRSAWLVDYRIAKTKWTLLHCINTVENHRKELYKYGATVAAVVFMPDILTMPIRPQRGMFVCSRVQ